ncbi:CAP domain-containing protein [Oceanicola sp. S124]|uniref:CAP domain-containing protein n=1 Tax=Oceanicola sp. S124 TaxID=1042378 RepID=UPI0002559C5D|nr:CAP domain-containing protein [Oceanicola sp. S124]
MRTALRSALGPALMTLLMACTPAETAPAAPPKPVDLLAEINAFRAARGRAPLAASDAAVQVAGRHAADLQRGGGISHIGSDGSTPGERLSREGVAWCRVAENLARGQSDGADVLSAWIESPRHRANLLGGYAAIGTARAGDIWVAVFLSPC